MSEVERIVKLLRSAETEDGVQKAVADIRRLAWPSHHQQQQQGDAEAQVRLALMYDRGDSVMPDAKEANKYFRLAAKQGHPRGQVAVGHQYYNGDGVVKNVDKAIEWYKKCAAQGCIKGLLALANCYEAADTKKSSWKKPKRWPRETHTINTTLQVGIPITEKKKSPWNGASWQQREVTLTH